MKKKIFNITLLIVFTAIVLYFSLKDNFSSTMKEIATMDLKYLFAAFLLLFIFWIFRSYPMYSFCKKMNDKFRYVHAFQLTLRTQFFNAITPFATGGQPYQIYYLKQCGINYASSTGIVLQNFIVYQIALVALGLVALFCNMIFGIFDNAPLLQKLIALGFIINTLVIVVMFLVAFDRKVNKRLINLGIIILTKFHIVKDKEKQLKKWDESINSFHESAVILLEDKMNFFSNIVYNFLALCCLYMIPYFLLLAMGKSGVVNPGISIVTSAYIMIIGSFVPIPGATGGLEYGFVQFYGNFITGPVLSATMLVWRFITYYFGLIVGAIALNIRRPE